MSTGRIMWSVSFCLLPAAGWGIYTFGIASLPVLLLSIAASLFFETAMNLVFKVSTLRDGSAFLTGLLIGMNMPPTVPLYIPLTAAAVAVLVVKWTFGGLGGNFMNPALAGRAFVFFSWTEAMSEWVPPRGLDLPDTLSTASPLGLLKTERFLSVPAKGGPVEVLKEAGYYPSGMDIRVTEWLNEKILSSLGIHLPEGYIDPFVGNISGSLGEVSVLLLLAGTVYLFAKKILSWEIPVSFFSSYAVCVWIFGGLSYDLGFFSGDVLFHLFTGGVILAGFYMATDYVTSPRTVPGMLIFGFAAGLLAFLLRSFGSFPGGVCLAILIMNVFVPLINKCTAPVRYGRKGGIV